MKKLSDCLADDLAERGISLVRDKIPANLATGMLVWGGGMDPLIVVDESIRDTRRINEITAHELIHYDRKDGNLLAMPAFAADMCEARARSATLLYCVSLERLADAYENGCRERWEFSEYLEIPEDTFSAAIERLQQLYGTERVTCGNWTFTFVPLTIRKTEKRAKIRKAWDGLTI